MKYLLIFFVASLLCSCRTHLTVSNNLPVEIYVNGKHKGKGEAYINRFGFKKTVNIDVYYSQKLMNHFELKRSVSPINVALTTVTVIPIVFVPYAAIAAIPVGALYALTYRRLDQVVELNPTQNKPSVWDQPPSSIWLDGVNNEPGKVGVE
jgi:hypothetical protein